MGNCTWCVKISTRKQQEISNWAAEYSRSREQSGEPERDYRGAFASLINVNSPPGYLERSSASETVRLLDRDFARAIADVKIVPQQQSDAKQRILAFVCNHFQVALFSEPIDQAYVSLQRNL